MAAKYIEISNLLTKRLKNGVYAIKPFPTERELTEEFDLSRNTVRKITDILVEAGYLKKTPNKSVEVVPNQGRLNIAFLAPAVYAEFFERVRFAIEHAIDHQELSFQTVDYVNWEDPVLFEALKRFDGVFMIPMSEDIPKSIEQRLQEATSPLVMFERNLTHLGIPSIISTPDFFVQHLMDHLAVKGHKNIHCLNTQNSDSVILGRVQQWQVWNRLHGGAGELIQDPVDRYGSPIERAYQMAKELFKKPLTATALICLTEPCAVGTLKAMWESGMVPGKDCSLVTFESLLCKYLHPSVTCSEFSDLTPYITICLDWFKREDRTWEGPLLLQPLQSAIQNGDSVATIT
jgi:DNA-binding LacI/PurR family transcriptional regulator